MEPDIIASVGVIVHPSSAASRLALAMEGTLAPPIFVYPALNEDMITPGLSAPTCPR